MRLPDLQKIKFPRFNSGSDTSDTEGASLTLLTVSVNVFSNVQHCLEPELSSVTH